MNQLNHPGLSQQAGRTHFVVENVKCGGCASSIQKAMVSVGLTEVEVSPEDNTVSFVTPEADDRIESAIDRLREMGYPLVDSAEGFEKMKLNAKSFVSCAIGKLS